MANVKVEIEVGSLIVGPSSFFIYDNWKNIHKKISFRALEGARSTKALIRCRSDDAKYNQTMSELSIIVQPLQRTLDIPKLGSVVEGQMYRYQARLTTIPASNVQVRLAAEGCMVLQKNYSLTEVQTEISVLAPDNFIDEGRKHLHMYHQSYLVSRPDTMESACASVSILTTILPMSKLLRTLLKKRFNQVKELGPLCLDEGPILLTNCFISQLWSGVKASGIIYSRKFR